MANGKCQYYIYIKGQLVGGWGGGGGGGGMVDPSGPRPNYCLIVSFIEYCTNETWEWTEVFVDYLIHLYRVVLDITRDMPNVQQLLEIQTLCNKVEWNSVKQHRIYHSTDHCSVAIFIEYHSDQTWSLSYILDVYLFD